MLALAFSNISRYHKRKNCAIGGLSDDLLLFRHRQQQIHRPTHPSGHRGRAHPHPRLAAPAGANGFGAAWGVGGHRQSHLFLGSAQHRADLPGAADPGATAGLPVVRRHLRHHAGTDRPLRPGAAGAEGADGEWAVQREDAGHLDAHLRLERPGEGVPHQRRRGGTDRLPHPARPAACRRGLHPAKGAGVRGQAVL